MSQWGKKKITKALKCLQPAEHVKELYLSGGQMLLVLFVFQSICNHGAEWLNKAFSAETKGKCDDTFRYLNTLLKVGFENVHSTVKKYLSIP